MSTAAAEPTLHDEISGRLAALDQRYTRGRRAIIGVLASAARPLTVPEILDRADRSSLPQSSAYRNLSVLVDAGLVHRVAGTDVHGRYELAEELAGHHHHLVCAGCGLVVDVSALPALEEALETAAGIAGRAMGFEVTSHRIDLVGRCPDCQPPR